MIVTTDRTSVRCITNDEREKEKEKETVQAICEEFRGEPDISAIMSNDI